MLIRSLTEAITEQVCIQQLFCARVCAGGAGLQGRVTPLLPSVRPCVCTGSATNTSLLGVLAFSTATVKAKPIPEPNGAGEEDGVADLKKRRKLKECF